MNETRAVAVQKRQDRRAAKSMTRPCTNCGAEIDDLTSLVHKAVHDAPVDCRWGIRNNLPFSLMPDVGRLLETFGVDLLQWLQAENQKQEHCCITGDCPHENQVECWQKLVEDCAADLRAKYESEKKPRCAPKG